MMHGLLDDGLDISQLKSFIEKKQWIDEKVKFLQDLPPIIALDPSPPLRSPTSSEELSNWCLEHEFIEKEVFEYDIGDLARLKNFAKTASKNSLSIGDTEYIEITLTTLLSVDKLFYLLRQRKKCLNLLNYRLKWETQIAVGWSEHRKILTELPSFLSKSRWTPPSELQSRAHKISSGIKAVSAHSGALLPPPTTSASPRTLSISLASLINPGSTPPRSTSAMSRTMRSEVLSLGLASQKSLIHSLTQSTLPNAVNLIDKLIDTSPVPLPDAFLDEEERLEEETRNLTEGLAGFLSGMVTQWRNSDELFWSTRGIEVEANSIMRDLEEAVLKLPDRIRAEGYEKRLKAMEVEIKDLEEKRWSTGFLPLPTHSSVEDQEEENRRLVTALVKNIARAKSYIERSKEAVEGYQFAVTSLEGSREVRREMEKKTIELNEFLIAFSELEGKPDLTSSDCLVSIESSTSYFNQLATLSTSIQLTLSSIQPLLLQSSQILVNLNKAGIDPNVRQAVRETMAGLSGIKEKVIVTLRREDLLNGKLNAGRRFENAVNLARKRIEEVENLLVEGLKENKWNGFNVATTSLPSLDLEALRQELDEILLEPTTVATQLLSTSEGSLLSHLKSQSSNLLPSFDLVLRQNDLLNRFHLQRGEASLIAKDFDTIDEEVKSLAILIQRTIDDSTPTNLNYQKDISTLDTKFNSKVSTIFKDITFLHSSLPPSTSLSTSTSIPSTLLSSLPTFLRIPISTLPSPINLSEHDESVRKSINSASAFIGGSLDSLKKKNEVLQHRIQHQIQHQIAVSRWDSDMKVLEEKLQEIENESNETSLNKDLDDSALEAFVSRITTALTAISKIRTELDSHSNSLTTLQADPISSSSLFNSHSARRSSLAPLTNRHQLTRDKFSSLLNLATKLIASREAALLERAQLAELELARKVKEEKKEGRLRLEEEEKNLKLRLEKERLETLELERLRIVQELEIARLETVRKEEEDRIELSRKEEVARLVAVTIAEETRIELVRKEEESKVEAERLVEENRIELLRMEEEARLEVIKLAGETRVQAAKVAEEARLENARLALEEVNRLAAEAVLVEENRLRAVELSNHLKQVEWQSSLSTMADELDLFNLRLDSFPLSPSPVLENLASARTQLEEDATLSDSLSRLDILDQEFAALTSISTDVQSIAQQVRKRIASLQILVEKESSRLDFSIKTASADRALEDVFGPIPVHHPFPTQEEVFEKSPIIEFGLRLGDVEVEIWQDQQPFCQLPNITDAEHLAKQLAPLEAQLQDLTLQDESFDYDSIKLELRRKTLAVAQIDSLAQFKGKVELADAAFSNLLVSIDNATPGMMETFERPDSPERNSSIVSLPDALRIAGNAITVVRKHSIALLEDSRVLAQIRRLELTFDDMNGMIEDLNPRRSFSSASATSSTYSNSGIPTPSRSNRSASASSSHNPRSTSSSSRPPSSLFSSSSSTFTRSGSKPSLQSYNTPNSQRKRTSSSASSAVSSIVSITPRPSRIHSTPNATPRAFAPPSTSKNSFGMSFGPSTASRKNGVISPTPSRRDRTSSLQNRHVSDTSPTFSLPTGASSRRSAFATSPTSSMATLPHKSRRRYKANPNSKIDVALAKVINDFPGSVYAKPADNNAQSECGMYWIGQPNPKLYFCRILRSKNIFLRTGGGWQNLLEFLNKNCGQQIASASPGSPNTRWITPAVNKQPLSTSTLSVLISRSLSAGLSPRISISDINNNNNNNNILATPRKAPIVPPPWKF